MLAYVFWHRPAPGVAPEAYAAAIDRFHRSLAARPPAGFVRSVSFRASGLSWFEEDEGFEDWYVIEDFAALGVLNAAAVGPGHLTAHDEAARRAGEGTGSVYRLLEGAPTPERARLAIWINKPRGIESPILAALLGDGLDTARAGLWQRQLALGPAPEYCVLAEEAPAGVAPSRLPRGWTAFAAARAPL